MYISVESPAALAFCRLAAALVSSIPDDLKALMMAKDIPLFLKQVKVAVELAAKRSTPFTANIVTNRLDAKSKAKRFFIKFNYKQLKLANIDS